ncbi:MAG TPA: DUF4440 domain-containing protein [Chitinophagaceae bacterium]|nr:DUF4440 domain-containing protein [Chitinophagaceae bacterium]
MRVSLLIFSFLFIAVCSFSQSQSEQAIRKILSRQTIAWNKGDVEGFMKGYWENDSLMFVGKSGITYGWNNTLRNYKKNYPDTTAMGKLAFNILSMKELSPQYFFVVGNWSLQRSIGNLSGYFTLLFQKINGGWKIICDHSS